MKKFFVYHHDTDHYINADSASLSPGGELCFVSGGELIASFHRTSWSFFKEIIEDNKND